MKISKFTCLYLLLATPVYAQVTALNGEAFETSAATFHTKDVGLGSDQLNFRWIRGSYLVYDCLAEHWACVSENNFKACKSIRERQIKDHFEDLSCAAIKGFDTELACKQMQTDIISRAVGVRVCKRKNSRVKK